MKNSIQKLIFLGILAEVLIFVGSYLLHPEWEETFRYAARYSGRLSALVFLFAFYRYAFDFPKGLLKNQNVQNLIKLFAVVHVIHFFFLAMNIYLNEITLVPVKLIGGALAYLMIVAAPFILHKVNRIWQLIYFYYVTIVMIVTYLSRMKGDFEGGEPFWFHKLALASFIAAALIFGFRMYSKRKSSL